MSWLSDTATGLSRVGCAVLPGACPDNVARALRRTIRKTTDPAVASGGTAQGLEELGGGLREGAQGLTDLGGELLEPIEDTLMWATILIGAVISLIVVGLLVWFVALPLMGLGGPRIGGPK